MAEETISLLVLFSFMMTLLSSPLISSRELSSTSNTSILNITDSLHRALHFSSVTEQSKQRIDESLSPSTLKLHLHPRESLLNSVQNDYKSRVLTQLTRDSIRVNSLQSRLDLVVHGINKSDLQPSKTDGLESPIVSGITQGIGEYFGRIGIGHPPSQLYVVIDTGSDISWIQCEPCSTCYPQSDPIFDPSNSSSFVSLSCNQPKCQALDVSECLSGHCLYEVSYGDGSYTIGNFATETISFENGATIDDFAIGCGHTNEGLFVGASGLLGLGGGQLSFPSQINASSFSYCLVDRDSASSSILEFNSSHTTVGLIDPTPEIVEVPLMKNPQLDTFYYLGLTGIRVGGEAVGVRQGAFDMDEDGNGGVIIDTGTAVTRLETEVYEALRDEFRLGAEHLPAPMAEGVAIFDTCYNLTGMSSVALPALELEFADGKSLGLPAKNYMIPIDTEGTFCLAFAGTASSMSIIGNIQQQGTRVAFDLVNSIVTFQYNYC